MIKGRNRYCLIGGWKYFTGVAGTGMDRVQGDYMGMLATSRWNGLQSALEKKGMKTVYKQH
jgi:uridylate kinase